MYNRLKFSPDPGSTIQHQLTSKQRHGRLVHVINILIRGLNPITAGTEDTVPKTSLLAIVVRLLPALAVVQIVVFDDQLCVEVAKEPAKSRGRASVNTKTGVACKLSVHDVLVADPPLVETHRETHQFHGEERGQRDTGDVEEFLLQVGVQGEQGVRVLGQMVGAVVLPQGLEVVHDAVVPVEPEVEDDAVQACFQGQPSEVHVGGSFGFLVGEEDGEHWSEG